MRIRLFSLSGVAVFLAAVTLPHVCGADLPVASESFPAAFEELLTKYAKADGVRYAAWHANPDDLRALATVTEFYATTRPPADRDAALAWHINAYNAGILDEILKKFPTDGPLAGEGDFFDKERILISGKKISFNHLEQKIIRPTFNDPRIHFALNCASESCPPLATMPFAAKSLDAELDRLTRAFINENPQGVDTKTGRPRVSKLFDWYAEDFGGKANLVAYINRYRTTPLPASGKVEFFDYSWKLNAAQ